MEFIWPWPKGTEISQEYGSSPGGVNPSGGHTGMDAKLPVGTALRAPADGVVEWANWATTQYGTDNPWLLTQGGGICLVINHGNGQPNTIMAHLSRTDLNVGDRVKQGDIVAYSGNTGTWTTGPHCHFEVMLDGYNIRSSTYGRSNPRNTVRMYWEDLISIQPSGSVSAAPLGYQRDSNVSIRQRSAPDHNSTLVKTWDADTRFDFGGFTTAGTDPYGDGNRTWFKGRYSDTWFHSSGFADKGTHDLQDLTPVVAPPVKPPVVVTPPTPTAPKYDFVQDIFKANGITVEKIPAQWDNYGEEFPDNPAGAVCHWWNNLANRPTFDSVVNEFCNVSTSKSPHFIVGETRIAQVVSLKDRAFHAGPTGNDKVGIEVDPYATERGADGKYTARALRIQANVRGLLLELRDYYKRKLTLHLHKEFMATSCSDLELATFDIPDVSVPVVVPPPVVPGPVDPTPVVPATNEFTDFLTKLIAFIQTFLANRK